MGNCLRSTCSSTTADDEAATRIDDLPIEMILEIFKNLTLQEIVFTCSKTSTKWRETCAVFILRPKLLKLARVNGKFRRENEEDGWTEECEDIDLISVHNLVG